MYKSTHGYPSEVKVKQKFNRKNQLQFNAVYSAI